jgi:hypothetical protein
VSNERHLGRWRDRLERAGIRFRAFFEPDLSEQLTALATEPLRGPIRQLFRNLRLLNDSGQDHSLCF